MAFIGLMLPRFVVSLARIFDKWTPIAVPIVASVAAKVVIT